MGQKQEEQKPAPGPNPMLRPLPPLPGPSEERLQKLELGCSSDRCQALFLEDPFQQIMEFCCLTHHSLTVALPLPSRTKLGHSKSVSSGDLRPVEIALGGCMAALSLLGLRPEPPTLRLISPPPRGLSCPPPHLTQHTDGDPYSPRLLPRPICPAL